MSRLSLVLRRRGWVRDLETSQGYDPSIIIQYSSSTAAFRYEVVVIKQRIGPDCVLLRK